MAWHRKRVQRIISFGVFFLAMGSILAYLWGDLFISEFQSDIADTLLWAEASAQSHSLINPDFFYPYVIPFGGNLLLVPFLAIFGYSITAIRAGMTAFTILLSIAFIAFFDQAVYRSRAKALLSTGVMLMLLENNRKLREIMYAHIIHYSLAILFILLMLIFLAQVLRSGDHGSKHHACASVLLAVTCFFCAAEGEAVIAFAIAPVLGACILERILRRPLLKRQDPDWKREIRLLLLLIGMVIAGFAFYMLAKSRAHTSYSEGLLTFDEFYRWPENLKRTIQEWLLVLFRPELYADAAPIVQDMSAIGIAFYIAEIAFMAASPIVLLILTIRQYGRLESRAERIAVLTFWILAAITIGLYAVTPINDVSWRMIPMLVMMFICYAILLKCAYRSESASARGFSALTAVLIAVFALNAGIGVLAARTEVDRWYEDGSLIDALRDHGLTHGYCDNFQMCAASELLTDGELQMMYSRAYSGRIYPILYQNQISDFAVGDDERFFFVRTEGLDEPAPERFVQRWRGSTFLSAYLKRDNGYCEYEVLIYDHSPIEPYYYDLHGNAMLDADGRQYGVQDILR